MQQDLTLYCDLEEGEKPDLATIARAALAFEAAVREVALSIDPFLDVRVELDSGTEGSLRLNSRLRSLRKAATDRRTLATVAITVATWLGMEVSSFVVNKVADAIWEEIFSAEVSAQQSDHEAREIQNEVDRAVKNDAGRKQIRKLYRELEADPFIVGVGATLEKDQRPRVVVRRESFQERGQDVRQVTEVDQPTPNSHVNGARDTHQPRFAARYQKVALLVPRR